MREAKPREGFGNHKSKVGGRRGQCKACEKVYRAKNREHRKQYEAEHRNTAIVYAKAYYRLNREKLLTNTKKYQADNRERNRAKRTKHELARRKTDMQHRLRLELRKRLWWTLRTKKAEKVGSAVSDLGCTIAFLKEYLSSLFLPGMSWGNWGRGQGRWQIDHIMPLVAFDLSDRQHLVLACHYYNLKPLWSEDNVRKLGKIPIRDGTPCY